MEIRLVCTVLSGETPSREKTEEIADTFKDCPYVYSMATKRNHLFAVAFLTRERAHIWNENQKKNPHAIFGPSKTEVTLTENIQHPRQLKQRLPRKPRQRTPCRLTCPTCHAYEKCTGCPATVFYRKNRT